MERIELQLAEWPSPEDFNKLSMIMAMIGVEVTFTASLKKEKAGTLSLSYDDIKIKEKRTRKAGPKRKLVLTEWTIGEIKENIAAHGTAYVLNELHIGKTTLYRRLHHLEEMGYTDEDRFW